MDSNLGSEILSVSKQLYNGGQGGTRSIFSTGRKACIVQKGQPSRGAKHAFRSDDDATDHGTNRAGKHYNLLMLFFLLALQSHRCIDILQLRLNSLNQINCRLFDFSPQKKVRRVKYVIFFIFSELCTLKVCCCRDDAWGELTMPASPLSMDVKTLKAPIL